MTVLNIAQKDMRILMKEPGTLVYLFLLPLVFILIFGGIASATVGESEQELVVLPVVNLDDGQIAAILVENLDAGGGITVVAYNQAEAEQLYEQEEIKRLLTIPAGFSDDLAAGVPVTIHLLSASTNADSISPVLSYLRFSYPDYHLQWHFKHE